MFKLPASDRLTHWRLFRKKLDHLPFEQALTATADLWEHCPFSPYYLDVNKPESWPDPWTMIEENWYCDIAKALGMLYTIKYSTHNPEVELRVYHDKATNFYYNLVWINDGKYVLNLEQGEVVNKAQIKNEFKLIKSFNSTVLKLDN